MRDLQVTTQATIEVIATVDKYQLKSFGFDQEAKFVLINWEQRSQTLRSLLMELQ